MATPEGDTGDLAAALGHLVPHALGPAPGTSARVAVSVIGDPVRVRAAWVLPDGTVVARIGCPAGVPSPVRPVIASVVEVAASGVSDHVVLGRVASGVTGARIILTQPDVIDTLAGSDGIIAARIPADAHVVAIEALDSGGEPLGRLERAGIARLRTIAGRLEGRMGATHGMAAGFGAGDTVQDLPTAEMEAGFTALLPRWLPEGLVASLVRVEPDAAYPFAPPSIAMSWTGSDESRVLIRQGPAPLAVPELPDAQGRAVDIGGRMGVIRGRGMSFLVWETLTRAFGLQAHGFPDTEAVALRVARSIPESPADSRSMT